MKQAGTMQLHGLGDTNEPKMQMHKILHPTVTN